MVGRDSRKGTAMTSGRPCRIRSQLEGTIICTHVLLTKGSYHPNINVCLLCFEWFINL